MSKHFQKMLEIIQQDNGLTAEQKKEAIQSLKDANKELEVTAFKLDRTEKVKRTTEILLEETIQELELKRKAVEEHVHELKIGSSLERVRTVAMGMRKPEDLLSICEALFLELKALGFGDLRNAMINIHDDKQESLLNYDYSESGKTITGFLYHVHPVIESLVKQMKRGRGSFFENVFSGEDLKAFKAFRKSQGEKTDSMLKSAKALYYYFYSIDTGSVGISCLEPVTPAQLEVLERFKNVFDLAYRRYTDIEKAEAQVREAKIEAALERVRSRTMAMHDSAELSETAKVLFDQLRQLGAELWTCGFATCETDNATVKKWMASPLSGQLFEPILIPSNADQREQSMYDAWKNGLDIHSFVQEGEELRKRYQKLRTPPYVNENVRQVMESGIPLPVWQINYAVPYKHGYLLIIATKAFEDTQIFIRFAKVFEQTYTRFLDLQKAEAQTREAQIEAALERVRSRSMAMHKSEELPEVIQLVFEQLRQLNFNIDSAQFDLNFRESDDINLWTAVSGQPYPTQQHIPFFNNAVFNSVKHAKEAGLSLSAHNFTFEEKNEFFNYFFKHTSVPEARKKFVLSSPGWARSVVYLDRIYLGIQNYSGIPYSEAEHLILGRFAKVFEQTYTRFLDLQKAEAQAIEATKRASVDRIRAEIASMRTTNDLGRITPLIWKELNILGIPFVRCGVFIMDEAGQQIHTFLSTPEGKAIAAFHLPYDTPGKTGDILTHWLKRKTYINHWDETDFSELGDTLVRQGALPSKELYMSTIPAEGIYLHCLPFLQGMLYVGNTMELKEGDIHLIQSVADAFSTAYARYEDFNKLEAAKQQVDKTLVDLKQAQAQLVQSEKMASLGELTAGIAHEIQNPLNFVNNFSEVSNELIGEMVEEVKKGNIEDATAIANDVKQNLEKILHHGKRADGIVKGMLQHSRSSSGVKEPTDINALADEYLRLAYHGLRAKDKSFNAKVETAFDESIEKVNVIPQDIGRVILNLITNAFYAVTEKKKQQTNDYEPEVIVSTQKLDDKILVRVKDNGNGIPQKVMDKIFQPFFTTKPTGQGTGLGLSLSYDIVKAHRGKINVETTEKEGSEFTIQIPIF